MNKLLDRVTLRMIPVFALCVCLLSCAHSGAERVKANAERAITLQRNGGPGDEKQIAEAFDRIKPDERAPEKLKTYDTRTLELLFQAASLTAGKGDRPELTAVLEDIFSEALSRGFVGDMIEQMNIRYVAERQWDKARELFRRFPSKELEVPEIVEPASVASDGPAVYDVSADGKRLTLEAVDLAARPLIVAVVDPGCHFSQDSDAAIAADPELAEAFAGSALNIYPAHFHLNAEEIAETNKKGGRRVKILYKASGWRGFDFMGTPHFYFVKDGKVVDEIEGIDPVKFISDLKRGVAKLGLKR